jgi:hypothetical protein
VQSPSDLRRKGAKFGTTDNLFCVLKFDSPLPSEPCQVPILDPKAAAGLHTLHGPRGDRDTASKQGALARRHTDGPLWAALLKTTVRFDA